MKAMVRAVLACALAGTGCEHAEPWKPVLPEPVPPYPGAPKRLTFSPEGDWSPVWLPDGSALGFSYQDLARSDRDRCLGFLPSEGGQVSRSICARGYGDHDTTNVISRFAVSPGGRLAFVAETSDPLAWVPAYRHLYLGSFDGSRPPRIAMGFPYLGSGGLLHYAATDLTWVDENTLVYLATYAVYYPGAIGIPPDTIFTGLELVRLDLVGDSVAQRRILGGTATASSVTLGPLPNTVIWTRGGDSRVFQRDLGTNQTSVLYDFGALGIAREVQLAGSKLVAVVGGRVAFEPFNPSYFIPFQWDSGGPVLAAQLPGGAPAVVVDNPGFRLHRRPALHPSGARVVAEGYGYVQRRIGSTIQTVVGKQADLWMYEVP